MTITTMATEDDDNDDCDGDCNHDDVSDTMMAETTLMRTKTTTMLMIQSI